MKCRVEHDFLTLSSKGIQLALALGSAARDLNCRASWNYSLSVESLKPASEGVYQI